MKIVSAHEDVIPISSSMSNAFIDFSAMDCSIVALVSDVVVGGEPVVGYGFSSNGRYSAGDTMRRRILPRLMGAPADSLLDENGELSPSAAWDVMMRNEKPGGHAERSVAVGVVDMALHDLAAKVAGVPLFRWISDHYGDGNPDQSVFVYAAGGYYAPGKSERDLRDEMKGFLDAGYNVVKMKIGGADLAEDPRRIEAVLDVLDGDGSRLAVDVNGRFDLNTALTYGRALDPYGLFWYEEVGDPLWPGGVPPYPGHARPARMVLAALHPSWWPPVFPAHRGGSQARRQRVLPRRVPTDRRIRRRRRGGGRAHHARRPAGHRSRGQGGPPQGPARLARVSSSPAASRLSSPRPGSRPSLRDIVGTRVGRVTAGRRPRSGTGAVRGRLCAVVAHFTPKGSKS
jgi:hypothetical protein